MKTDKKRRVKELEREKEELRKIICDSESVSSSRIKHVMKQYEKVLTNLNKLKEF